MFNFIKVDGKIIKMRCRRQRKVSAQEERGYYKQITEVKYLKNKSWLDNENFDFIDTRKTKM